MRVLTLELGAQNLVEQAVGLPNPLPCPFLFILDHNRTAGLLDWDRNLVARMLIVRVLAAEVAVLDGLLAGGRRLLHDFGLHNRQVFERCLVLVVWVDHFSWTVCYSLHVRNRHLDLQFLRTFDRSSSTLALDSTRV